MLFFFWFSSRITGLSVALKRLRTAEHAAAAERMIRLESRAVAKELELQVIDPFNILHLVLIFYLYQYASILWFFVAE
jgi:hypothetical protein